MLSLMRRIRNAIIDNDYPAFVQKFFDAYFGNKGPPAWAIEALKAVDIKLKDNSGSVKNEV